MPYDAFVSYSHAADGRLAPALQAGLQRLAKPWHRLRALRVFRDESGLSTNPHLWSSIEAALDDSAWFILLASPEAADSSWVNREIEHWLETKAADRILVVLTDGELTWDARRGALNAERSSAAPPALRAALNQEPRYLDLRWARSTTDLDLRNSRFRAAVADLAAPIHGVSKDELEGEDVRQHRRTQRTARGAVGTVTLLFVVAVAAAVVALLQRNEARHQSALATSRELARSSADVIDSDPELGLLLAVEAIDRESTPEAIGALRRAIAAPTVRERTPPGTVVTAVSSDGSRAALVRKTRITVIDVESGRRVGPVLRHQANVNAVRFAAGGRRLASIDDDGRATLWDLRSGDARSLDQRVSAIDFSPDGTRVVAVIAPGGSASLLDVRGRAVATLDGVRSSPVYVGSPTARFAADGGSLVTWDEQAGEARVWDAARGALRSVLAHGAPVTSAAISPDGRTVLTAGRDWRVRLWDASTGVGVGPVLAVPPSDDPYDVGIASASFANDRTDRITTVTQTSIQVWDASTGAQLSNDANQFTYLREAGFGPRSPYLVTGTSIRDAEHARTVIDPSFGVTSLHEDGRFEAIARRGDSSTLWSGEVESAIARYGREALDVSFARGRFAVSYADGTVELRRARDGTVLAELAPTDDLSAAFEVELASDGRTVVFQRGPATELWDADRGTRIHLDPSVLGIIGFSADARRLLVSTGTGFAVLDTANAAQVGSTIPVHATAVQHAALSPDGRLLFEGNVDSEVVAWRVADGKPAGRALTGFHDPTTGHDDVVADLAASSDGQMLAAGGFDGLVVVWDLESGRRRATIRGHDQQVVRVAFSRDDRLLLTRSSDGTLRVWEAATGAPVAVIADLPTGAPRPDVGLDFAASSDEILRADDGFVYRIPCGACVSTERLLELARSRVRRELTTEERRQYLHEDAT